jgi:hypothetical protein
MMCPPFYQTDNCILCGIFLHQIYRIDDGLVYKKLNKLIKK